MTTAFLLPAALAFIMFALGLTLTPADFWAVARRPKAVAVGLAAQVIGLPAVAFAVASAWQLPPLLGAGLMLLAACPGGVSAGLITHLARGDTALSISLTAITSLLALLSVPLVVDASLRHFLGSGVSVELPVLAIIRGVFILTTLPVALGMLLRHYRRDFSARIEPAARRLATLLFLAIVVATFIAQRELIAANLNALLPATLALNLAVLAAGYAAARGAGLGRADRVAIAVECGLQNAALAIFIANSVLATPALAAPAVVYALLMNLSAIVLIVVARRRTGAVVGTPP